MLRERSKTGNFVKSAFSNLENVLLHSFATLLNAKQLGLRSVLGKTREMLQQISSCLLENNIFVCKIEVPLWYPFLTIPGAILNGVFTCKFVCKLFCLTVHMHAYGGSVR